MRTIKTMMLSAALAAPAVFAQDPVEGAKKRVEEVQMRTGGPIVGAHIMGGQTFEFVGGQMVSGNPVKGAPYSAEAITESTQTLQDGNRIVHRSSSTLYRDSEGRERREESFDKLGNWNAEGEPAKAIFISDPVAKTSYTLDTKSRTAHKMPAPMVASGNAMGSVTSGGGGNVWFSAPGTPAEHAPVFENRVEIGPNVGYSYSRVTTSTNTAPPNAKTEQLGKRMIEGVQAEGTRTTITIPAGQEGNERPFDIVSERWYSPELQMTVSSKHSDPRHGETVYKLTNVNRSEPMRSLFEVPADYTVSEPTMRVRTLPGKVGPKDDQLQ